MSNLETVLAGVPIPGRIFDRIPSMYTTEYFTVYLAGYRIGISYRAGYLIVYPTEYFTVYLARYRIGIRYRIGQRMSSIRRIFDWISGIRPDI